MRSSASRRGGRSPHHLTEMRSICGVLLRSSHNDAAHKGRSPARGPALTRSDQDGLHSAFSSVPSGESWRAHKPDHAEPEDASSVRAASGLTGDVSTRARPRRRGVRSTYRLRRGVRRRSTSETDAIYAIDRGEESSWKGYVQYTYGLLLAGPPNYPQSTVRIPTKKKSEIREMIR